MFALPSLNKAFRPVPLIAAGAAVAAALTYTVGSPRPHRQHSRPETGLMFPADPTAVKIAILAVAKDIVACDVLAGRLTFVQAATLFGWLNDQNPPLQLPEDRWAHPGLVAGPGGWTREETLCLHTINRIECRAEVECPARVGKVRAALVAEFEAERACGRPVALPAAPEPECHRLLALAAEAWERCRYGQLPGYSRPGLRAYLEQVVKAGTEPQRSARVGDGIGTPRAAGEAAGALRPRMLTPDPRRLTCPSCRNPRSGRSSRSPLSPAAC